MLDENLIKATVELQGFRATRVSGDASGVVAVIEPDLRFPPRCGRGLEAVPYRDIRPMRWFRHVPMWGIPVELCYAPGRVSAPRRVGVHVEAMPWVSGKQRMTRALMVTLVTWRRVLPWKEVARLFGCPWGAVATAVEEAVAYGLAHRDLEGLTHFGIDAISRKCGHVYVTNVCDLERKRLIGSGEGRKEAILEAFRRAGTRESGCARRGLFRHGSTLHQYHQGPIASGGSGLRPVPHRAPPRGSHRPGATR